MSKEAVLPDSPPLAARAEAATFYEGQSKPEFVRRLFDRISGRYDMLNSVMTGGMHHRWRAATVAHGSLEPGDWALDVACGTGDFLPLLARKVGASGRTLGIDFSRQMLRAAGEKLGRKGVGARLVQGDAERLPFRSNLFHAVTIGFALRNLDDVDRALGEMFRVLRPSGRLLALEIRRPGWTPYRQLFLYYFERVLPRLARAFGGNEEAYRWLPASLAAFYSRQGVVAKMRQAGFERVEVRQMALGAICIYIGHKI